MMVTSREAPLKQSHVTYTGVEIPLAANEET